MTCANCAANIERVLGRLDGVESAAVNFATEQASVTYRPGSGSLGEIVAAVEKAGFGVPVVRSSFPVVGMTCANCAANIERALKKKVPGVVDATVQFASERASAVYIPGLAGPDDLVQSQYGRYPREQCVR